MFSDEEKNEIYRKYKLSEEEHMELYGKIKKIWTMDKTPVDNPVAVIVGGQTGAGKTGLIIYSKKMFADGNVVVINSDEIKPFHPKSEEIAREYPGEYTWITAQESEDWTSRLFGEVRNEGYNIIFEVPMKNNRIADDAIVDLLNKGYTVIVRGLAVCDLESRLSILERYEEQVAKRGWGRLVLPEHHDATYNGMPNTIKYIEETGRYDISSDMFVLIQRYDTVPQTEARYEAHRKYIDIQYIIKGKETIYWSPLSEVEEIEPFNEDKDIGFYEKAVPHAILKLHEGEFGIFYPCDAHKPSFHEDENEASFVEKAVVKIRV